MHHFSAPRWPPVPGGLPPPPPFFSSPPPKIPPPGPPPHWDPSVPPNHLGFPPRPFPPRGMMPPLGPRQHLALPPSPFPPHRGLPPQRIPRPRGLPPGVIPPPTGLPPMTVPPPGALPPGVIPPPRTLPPGVFPPPGGFQHGSILPPGVVAPTLPRPGCHQPRSEFGLHGRGPPPGPSMSGRPPSNVNFNGGSWKNGSDGHWSNKRKANDSFSKQPKQKKQKVDKRDLPENNAFVCETCDRGFKAEDAYRTHIDAHEKCHVAGCQFTAHPKIVKLHYECQHRSGLAKKIWQLESKEDIASWISERKRNYPTDENAKKKKQVWEDKVKRGDVVENKFFGKFHRQGRGGRGQGRGRFNNRYDRRQPQIEIDKSTFLNGDNIDTLDSKSVLKDEETEKVKSSAAGDLSETKSPVSEQTELRKNVFENRRKEEINPLAKAPPRTKKRNSLLERLLVNEIRHERNVLLQCVRFVVNRFNLNDAAAKEEKTSREESRVSEVNVQRMEAPTVAVVEDVSVDAGCTRVINEDSIDMISSLAE